MLQIQHGPAKPMVKINKESSKWAFNHLQQTDPKKLAKTEDLPESTDWGCIGGSTRAHIAASRSRLQRLVDEDEAKKRVTKSEFKDLKNWLEAGGRTPMNMLKSDPLEHLAVSDDYEKQDHFVATKLYVDVENMSPANQIKLIDNAVSTADLLESLAGLST
jgi:hypothetical protein